MGGFHIIKIITSFCVTFKGAFEQKPQFSCCENYQNPFAEKKYANCNIKLSISSVRISLETARCGLGEEGAVGDRRGQAERAGQAAKILSISASKASSGVL